jgi:hypothetical protein
MNKTTLPHKKIILTKLTAFLVFSSATKKLSTNQIVTLAKSSKSCDNSKLPFYLEEKLTVISETDNTLYLKSSDPIIELVHKWHYGMNEHNNPTEIIVFYAGVEDQPITIIKGDFTTFKTTNE